MPSLSIDIECWPLKSAFTIARGTRTEITVVVASVTDGVATGRGECFPHVRYGENVEGVVAAMRSVEQRLATGLSRTELLDALPSGAARNALDCAMWDLEVKQLRASSPQTSTSDITAWQLAGLQSPPTLTTVMTISIDSPDSMAKAARQAIISGHRKLKVKLGGGDGLDIDRIDRIRAVADDAALIVDANEGWRACELERYMAAMADADVRMIEQPLPAAEDGILASVARPVPIGADESCHTRQNLPELREKYEVINIKLDKSGGLTEALALASEARALGFDLMVGCMLGTSLAMAPATLVAPQASYVDLDGPLWLASDRANGLAYDSGHIGPVFPELWG
ncbi:MAG: N-acetyl-D-Glu racemase DgcA [Hyphomicrobiaceae bacterium]